MEQGAINMPRRAKRTGGNRRAYVADRIHDVGKCFEVVSAHCALIGAHQLRGLGHDEMRFDLERPQDFQRPRGVDQTCGAANADDYALPFIGHGWIPPGEQN
jgi:hypothetical protein